MPTRKYSTAPIDSVFGKWTVLSYSHAEFRTNRKVPRWIDFWNARCECGKEQIVEAHALANGTSTGCRNCGKKRFVHGHATKGPSPEYSSWAAMKDRCLNPNRRSYHRYGGRGITICPAWLNSFPQFLVDMGPKPTPAYEIERRNNDGNYEPDNCYWATRQEQAQNMAKTRRFTHNNETLIMSEWARRAGMHRATFRMHIEKGKTVGEILAIAHRYH